MKAINQKIAVGVLWNLASIFVTRGASTIFMLFLARLLAPESFGMIAMVTVVFELANAFINSGLGLALIRSKEVSNIDFNTVFYINLGLSLLAYTMIFFSAPYVADFYSQPELALLLQVMGLVVFINGAKIVQVAVLSRKMDFKTQMKANTLATGLSGILAIGLAYYGWGVWSLVVLMLFQALLSALVLWIASSWRPGLQFSKESFLRLFAFGRNLLAEGLLSVAYRNSHILVIGRFFGADLTGLYFFAKKINDLISQQLTRAVEQATFPALATLQCDNVALKYKYRQIMQLMMFLIAPIMMLLAALASPLIGFAFGEKWQNAVPYLKVLCFVGMIYPLHALNISLLNVKGRSDLVLKVGLVKKATNLTLLFLALPYGVLGVVISQVIGTILALIPNTYFSAKLLGYSLVEQIKDVIKPIGTAMLSGGLAWWLADILQTHQAVSFMLSGLFGVGIYILVSFVVRAEGVLMLWSKRAKWQQHI